MNLANQTDERLLELARRDERAFVAFYDRHEAPLLAYLLRLTKSPELAADIAAEVFASLLQAVIEEREVRHARGWLYAVARNQLALAAKRSVVDSRARAELQMRPIELSQDSVEGILELGEDHAPAALAALAALPPDERTAVEGRVIGELDYSDLAERLRCSEAVVRQRVSRGLGRLRARMEGQS